jgi:SAM-dependent methyltransferase
MTDNDWWLPSRLKADEASARLLNDFSQLDAKGDFGSYRRLVLGDTLENSNASVHNDLFPRSKVHQIFRYLDLGNPTTILDAGCGLGYTTTVIAEVFPNARVLGIDLAEDAITYAKNQHKNASFGVVALDPSGERIGSFDLIFCFEIYTFSTDFASVFDLLLKICLFYLVHSIKNVSMLLKCNSFVVTFKKSVFLLKISLFVDRCAEIGLTF